MQDDMIRVTAAGGMVRGFFIRSTQLVERAASLHQSTPVITAALGRLLSAAAMMGWMLKNDDDMLTLAIRSEGPAQGLLATADAHGHVKGYPYQSQVEVPNKAPGKLDVGAAIGPGSLTVTRDMGYGEPYSGTVALVSGEIAEDIAYYFAQSEQTPSAVSLGVLIGVDYHVQQAGGWIIQLMPGASDELAANLEQKMAASPSLTTLYAQGHRPESLAELFFADLGYTIEEHLTPEFCCQCSRERVEKALLALGKAELERLLQEDGGAQLCCQFCGKEYALSAEDLQRLIAEITAQ